MDEDISCDNIPSKLIEKVQSLVKKPSLDTDIHKILDQVLANVERRSVYLENGIYNFNFAEAAIILEQVTLIYGKKIDILWDNLLNYQKSLLKFTMEQTKAKAEEQMIEERRQKYKRKRRKPPDQAEDIHAAKKIDTATLLARLEKHIEENERLSLRASCFQDFENLPVDPERPPRDKYLRKMFVPTNWYIRTGDEENDFDNYDLLSNLYNFSASDFIRQTKYNILDDDDIQAIGYDLYDEFAQDYLVEKSFILSELKSDKQLDELEEYVSQKIWERMPLHQRCQKLCPRRSSIMLTRLSDDVVAQYLKPDRRSVSTNISHDSGISDMDISVSHSEMNEYNEFGEGTSGCTSSSATEIQENEAMQSVPSAIIDIQKDSLDPTAEIACSDSGTTNISNLIFEEAAGSTNTLTEGNKSPNFNKTVQEETIVKQRRQKCKREKVCNIEEEAPKPKKLRRTPVIKLRKIVTKSLYDFEIFFYENYKVDMGEGILEISHFVRTAYMEQAKKILFQDRITVSVKQFELFFYKNYQTQDFEGTLIEPDYDENEPRQTGVTQNAVNFNDSGIFTDFGDDSDTAIESCTEENPVSTNATEEVASENENISLSFRELLNPQPSTSTAAPKDDDVIFDIFKQQHIRSEKYMEWKAEINSKLSATDKNDFDIHQYESKILDMLPDKEDVPLNRVMSGNKSSEVARLFVATLQLVNSSNVEFKNVKQGELANDSLEMRLLSRDRHHVQLESYQAPSLEQRKEAIRKIKAKQGSTVPLKKRKLC